MTSKKKTGDTNIPATRTRSKKDNICCPVLDLALTRTASSETPHGLMVGMYFDGTNNLTTRTVVKFPKAKKGEDTPAEFKDVTYALVKFCPFCGKEQP
jgi:hypothetical protein